MAGKYITSTDLFTGDGERDRSIKAATYTIKNGDLIINTLINNNIITALMGIAELNRNVLRTQGANTHPIGLYSPEACHRGGA